MGYFTASMGLPLAVAPLLGIWMANRGNFTALFLLAAGITGVALVFSWVMRVPHRQRPDVGERGLKISSMFERTALLPASLMFLLLVTFGLILALLALYGKERGIASVGAWFTVYAIALTAARGLTGRPADRWGYRQMAALGFVLAAAGLVVVSMADNLWILLLSAVIYGLGYGTTQPSLQALLIARSPAAQRGAATAVFFFAYDLGTTLGSIGGGILAGVIGLSAVFALSALCPVVGIAVLLIHLRRVPLPRVA
jgi:MFS family permease